MEEQKAQSKVKDQFIGTIIGIILFGAVMYWVFVISPSNTKKEERMRSIADSLSQSTYTQMTSYTVDDFKAEEVVKSDYKPIYKVTTKKGEVFYVGLIIPDGKYGVDSHVIGQNLTRVQESMN